MMKYKVNSYLSIAPAFLFGIDDQSSILSINFEIEPFQAFTVNFIASYPFGWDTINSSWYRGEFGPTNIGYYQNYKIMVKIKF